MRSHHLVVDRDRAVLADGSHREFAVPRDTQLADQDHVDRRPERLGDLERHRDATAREPDDDHRLPVLITAQRGANHHAELPACVDAIVEHEHIVARRAPAR